MPFYAVTVLLQVAFVVHIIRSGRNTRWIWIVIMLPVAGLLAYLVIEMLPEFMGSRTGRKTSRLVADTLNPNRALNQAANDFSVANTVENSMRLADALMAKNQFAEAQPLYRACLRGVHKDDAHILFSLAKAEAALQNHAEVKTLLDELIAKNPDYKNADAHLLYACTLDQLGEHDAALHEYETLHGYYPGPEATFHFAMLQKRLGRGAQCRQLLEDIARKAKTGGRHYNDLHREWIKKASQELKA